MMCALFAEPLKRHLAIKPEKLLPEYCQFTLTLEGRVVYGPQDAFLELYDIPIVVEATADGVDTLVCELVMQKMLELKAFKRYRHGISVQSYGTIRL